MKKLMIATIFVCILAASVFSQTTGFTFQGSLKDGASPANGNYDLEFKLFDLVSGGAQQGSTLQRLNVAVADGSFTVSLDFGAGTLPGADRFLDIAVRAAGGGAFTALNPRQPVTSAPYSVRSLNSTTADVAANATQLGGVAADQYVVTTDPRMTDARQPTAGSPDYIQNGSSQQASSNFNISGTGSANIFDAGSFYNLSGGHFITSRGLRNTLVGQDAGRVTTGPDNAFFGYYAGYNHTASNLNTFLGPYAGFNSTSGSVNTFVGARAGDSNVTGGFNTILGYNADVGGINLFNATAIGYNAIASQSNSLILGSGANVGIGTSTPQQLLHVDGDTEILSTGVGAGFKFRDRGSTSPADDWVLYSNGNVARLFRAGVGDLMAVKPDGNVGLGTADPHTKLQIAGGSIYVQNPSSLIITSPNGACWFITVNNAGALSTISVTCP